MARAFKLPDLGEGIHEGEIIAVRVSVGDAIREGDVILEVETDKAAVEIPSPFTGTVETILVNPGDLVNVGEVMITFSGGDESEAPVETGAAGIPAVQSEIPPASGEMAAGNRKGPVPASPATRRLARELDVVLHEVKPSGPAGLVTAEDVRSHAEKRDVPASIPPGAPSEQTEEAIQGRPLTVTVPPLPDFSRWGPVRREPVRSIRRATARQMALSWSQIPHVNCQDTVDITALDALRKRHKERVAREGGKLTLTVFALKAVASALRRYPQFNTSLDTRAGEIVHKSYCHVGMAVDAPNGLVVPVVRDVDKKSIVELSIETAGLVRRTRERKVSLEELQGGTFTITNAGAMGGGFFSPIINYPEVAILGMGQARWQPAVRTNAGGDHRLVPRFMMPMVICVDHRVLDGSDAVKFLSFLKQMLEEPEEMLMNMI